MKKWISLFLIPAFLCVGLSSCKNKEVVAPTCEEVIAAYQEAGYHVSHRENKLKDDSSDEICYVQVWLDDPYESVYFNFFESTEAAEAMDDERQFNVVIYLFTVIYGDPSWLWSEAYGNIQYEYEDPDMIKPFEDLIG